jgi:hypothetical protein
MGSRSRDSERMRLGHRPVKLPIANVRMIRWSGKAAVPAPKNPAKTDIFTVIATFRRTPPGATLTLTKTGRSRISRANCPRWPGSTGGGSFGAVNGPFSGRPASPDAPQSNRQNCPVSGEITREADLSTQQTGAQAPSRLPRPSRHRWRPQGSRRPPCAWPQASERLSRIFRRFHSWIG